MFRNYNKRKVIVLCLGLAAMLAPLTMNAQYRENQFGIQEWGQTSLLGKEASRSSNSFNITTGQFGGNGGQAGGDYGISIGTMGQDSPQPSPLGSGLFIMAAAGAAYAFSKKRKKQENN
jgi:hypothetical protein